MRRTATRAGRRAGGTWPAGMRRRSDARGLADFLQQCDFVKFAGASLAVTDMEALFRCARGFVMETGEPAAA